MKYLRWVGLMTSLLIVGAIGELMTPLPSEALTVTIDGTTVQITTTSAACTSGYNLCSFIPPGRYGNWTVGDVSSTNKARIMIGDNSAANSLDLLKLTGITFTPVVTAGTKTTTVVVTHTYNAGGGNPQGDYSWGYGMAGYFDPPSTESMVGNRLQQTGRGNFAGTNVTLGLGLDTGVLATPSTNNLNGSVTRTRAATVVRANCNTGSGRCAPTITQTFTITVAGADKLVLTDSVIGAGGTCRPVDQVIPIPPHLYKLMLKLDPHAPNDINQLSAWLAKMGQKYLKNKQAKALLAYLIAELDKWLAKTVPGTCPEIQEELNAVIEDDVEAELAAAEAAGAVPAEPGGTITITKNTGQETSDTFTFAISGPSSSTQTISMDDSSSQAIVVTVEPGTYTITENPLSGWTLTSSSCGEEGPTTGVVVEVGGNVDCTFDNNAGAIYNGHEYRVINQTGVTWNEARAQAQGLGIGWNLATITSQGEQEFIQSLLPPNPRDIPGTLDYWIAGEQPSGSQEPGGTWRWTTNSFVFYNNGVTSGGYANWGTASTGPDNEPNNLGGNENHVTMDNRYGWGWNDLNGDGGTHGFVAKRPISP
ncbi:MAG: C-type lectin domain-containing protein [Nitrospira sp.]